MIPPTDTWPVEHLTGHHLQWVPPSSFIHQGKIPKISGREDVVQARGEEGEPKAATEWDTGVPIYMKEREKGGSTED